MDEYREEVGLYQGIDLQVFLLFPAHFSNISFPFTQREPGGSDGRERECLKQPGRYQETDGKVLKNSPKRCVVTESVVPGDCFWAGLVIEPGDFFAKANATDDMKR